MTANQADFPIASMARVLGASKAGDYAWVDREPSAHAVADVALLKRICTIHLGSRETYSASRVHAELREQSERHSRKRVTRLRREASLVGCQSAFKRDPGSASKKDPPFGLVQFANARGQRRAADPTSAAALASVSAVTTVVRCGRAAISAAGLEAPAGVACFQDLAVVGAAELEIRHQLQNGVALHHMVFSCL